MTRLLLAFLLLCGPVAAQVVTTQGVPASGTGTAALPGPFALGDTSGNFNVGAPQLPRWRRALARVRAGTGRGQVLVIGDSTTIGTGAGTGGSSNLNGAWPKGWPNQLAAILAPTVPTSSNSFIGGSGQPLPVAYGTFDTRVVQGTGWNTNGPPTVGGAFFKFTNGSGAGTLAFTPTGQIDTIKVWYLTGVALGSMAVNVDGGASLGTIATVAVSPGTATSTTFTVAKGAHTINLVTNADGNIFVIGVVAWDSTTPAIDIIQAGEFGSGVANWVMNTVVYDPLVVLPNMAPDLVIICLTINDSNNVSQTVAAYQASLQTIITAIKANSDVILMVGPPSNTTQATNGTLDRYIGALRQLAITNNVGLLDLKQRWTSYAVTNPFLPYFDTLHPGALGYQDIGLSVTQALHP